MPSLGHLSVSCSFFLFQRAVSLLGKVSTQKWLISNLFLRLNFTWIFSVPSLLLQNQRVHNKDKVRCSDSNRRVCVLFSARLSQVQMFQWPGWIIARSQHVVWKHHRENLPCKSTWRWINVRGSTCSKALKCTAKICDSWKCPFSHKSFGDGDQ